MTKRWLIFLLLWFSLTVGCSKPKPQSSAPALQAPGSALLPVAAPLPPDAAPPKPLPEAVRAAWEKAGARSGWLGAGENGGLEFRPEVGNARVGELPGFQLNKWQLGVLGKLPLPEAPFGLDISGTQVTDAGLKELAGLKQLQSLNLSFCKQVTDAGLKELTSLQQLQKLHLNTTQVTDAGLKDLAGLKQLQSL